MKVELTRRADGASIFRCTRLDGSAVWQKHQGSHAGFFPFHDLTHFGVETTLGFQQGFFGLIAIGWEIADTEGKGARGALPTEAILVEHIVGLFDRERGGGAEPLGASEFNGHLARALAPHVPQRIFSDAELSSVRLRVRELHDDYAALSPDGTLMLTFEPARQPL